MGFLAAAFFCVSCGQQSSPSTNAAIDPQLASRGKVEVTAKLVEVPDGAIFKRDLYDYATVLKYEVVKVHRGEVKGSVIYVGHYNPWKPRGEAADRRVKDIGGNLRQFQAGAVHRLALSATIDDHYLGGIVNKYFGKTTEPIYWAEWTNLGLVMLLGGLWHGAKWNFIVWGAWHGLFLGYERWRGKQSFYESFPRPLRIALTFLLVLWSWVVFRADNLTAALNYFAAMFGRAPASDTALLLGASLYTPYRLVSLAVCALLVFQTGQAHDWAMRPLNWRQVAILVPLFLVSLVAMFAQHFNPFLYFQF